MLVCPGEAFLSEVIRPPKVKRFPAVIIAGKRFVCFLFVYDPYCAGHGTKSCMATRCVMGLWKVSISEQYLSNIKIT